MKFWKSLSILIEDTLPEWRDKFLSYKDLKKQLKLIYPKDGDKPPTKRLKSDASDPDSGAVGGGGDVTKEVIDFVRLLEDEMEKLNSFIVEKEEDSVIKWKVRDVVPLYLCLFIELQDGVAEARDSKEELMRIGREIVDLHGEMILLENYSALNYTGLVKILKKYDKRSGALLRVPFIRKVTQQPFFTTHVLNKLVKECEATLDSMFTRNEPATTVAESRDQSSCEATTVEEERSFKVPNELNDIENMESMYMKQTLSALRVLKEVRSGSSTVNMFSLPPLPSQSMEDDWKKVSVVEQAAK
ncbi:SPX domain-containing protein 2 [Linum perenne]